MRCEPRASPAALLSLVGCFQCVAAMGDEGDEMRDKAAALDAAIADARSEESEKLRDELAHCSRTRLSKDAQRACAEARCSHAAECARAYAKALYGRAEATLPALAAALSGVRAAEEQLASQQRAVVEALEAVPDALKTGPSAAATGAHAGGAASPAPLPPPN